ncbi:MAG: hypothetical protein CMP67_11045 [Flavobacteriales bacterium]|nr:hypothetical protein [Flavobacteriales bacterium]MBO73331.1 hypothetical protein [Flavobacteriales bacterium]|tara:strand:+ start:650 stop:1444 length:795 start_codon:yes stop_codon:yes gene_type:complete
MTRNIIFLFLASVVFISCKKDNSEVYTQSAKDAALGEVLIVDVLKQILYTSPNFLIDEQDSIINGIILSSEPEVSDSAFPKTITIDYGDGVTGVLGKMRKGKIILKINSGTVITENLEVSFENFSSDGSSMWGNILYAYNPAISGYDGELLNNGISIVNPNGTMKLNGSFSLSKSSTSGTVDLMDDIYDFECVTSGIDFEQTSFDYNTSKKHVVDFSCKDYIISGESNLMPYEKASQIITFGDGNCDAIGTIMLEEGQQKNFNF